MSAVSVKQVPASGGSVFVTVTGAKNEVDAFEQSFIKEHAQTRNAMRLQAGYTRQGLYEVKFLRRTTIDEASIN